MNPRKLKTHAKRLDGSTICGAKGEWIREDSVDPTCGKCRAYHAKIKARVKRDWEKCVAFATDEASHAK